MQTQNSADGIDTNAFDQWMVNLKIMYLVFEELKTDRDNLPPTTSELGVFVYACINGIPSTSPEQEFKTFLKESSNKKNFKKLIKKKIEENPTPQNPKTPKPHL